MNSSYENFIQYISLSNVVKDGYLSDKAVSVGIEVTEHLLRHPLDALDGQLQLHGLEVLVLRLLTHHHEHALHLLSRYRAGSISVVHHELPF